jgi:hypothetical protein
MFLEAAEQKAAQVGLGWAVTHLREQAGLTEAELSGQSGLADAELLRSNEATSIPPGGACAGSPTG